MTQGLPAYHLLRILEDSLRALASEHKGSVEVAHDPSEAISWLSNAPNAWRIIIGLDDEDSAETSPTGLIGVSDTEIYVIIQAGVGLGAKPSKEIHRQRGEGPSILELAEATRCWIRGLKISHPDIYCGGLTFAWKSSTWASYKDEGKPLFYARQHIFTVRHNISYPAKLSEVAIA